MERRYQVFVSSTFKDLEEERREVSGALLKSDCFPAGMELFPAADLEQFEYIRQIIDESDYYIVISAGRYGSLHPKTELSYTEMEYDYALKTGKPIIRLLHKDPFSVLPGDSIEPTDRGKERLRKFRAKLTESNLVNFWNGPKELGQQVILALLDIKKRKPLPGWVRGDNAVTVELLNELTELRKQKKSNGKKQKEQLVKFDDLVGESEVQIMISDVGGEHTEKAGTAKISKKEIAEAVFLALISDTKLSEIEFSSSASLTQSFDFPDEYTGNDHYWLEIGISTTEHFLHYLESRGLLSFLEHSNNWKLSPPGRRHATYLSSLRHLA